MIDKETDARMIGYGRCCARPGGRGALIAVCALSPATTTRSTYRPLYATRGLSPSIWRGSRARSARRDRTHGGAVSLAVGFAQIFSASPPCAADVILVPLRDHVRGPLHPDDHRRRDAGRTLRGAGPGRDLEAAGAHGWIPARLSHGLVVVATDTSSSQAPSRSLAHVRHHQPALSCVALCVGTTVIINAGRARTPGSR